MTNQSDYYSHEEAHKKVREANDKDWWPRALLYAKKIVNEQHWHQGCPKSPDDLVGDAVCKLIDKNPKKRRSWPRNMDLTFVICQIIRSDVSNLIRSSQNNKLIYQSSHARIEEFATLFEQCINSPEDDHIKLEQHESIMFFINSLKNDPLVYEIARLMYEENMSKPQALAEILKKSVKEIDNAKKRLRRRYRQWTSINSVESMK